MTFLIADTFTESITRLTAAEQKAVKTTTFDLQVNPSHPSLKFHRVDRARDKHFWSVRAGSDLRIIVHKTTDTFVLCYAGHHDDAYQWAERRRLEAHPVTGAAQLVEFHERVQEILVPRYVAEPLCAHLTDQQLLSWGVPDDWLDAIRAADEDQLLSIAEHLPAEAGEVLIHVAAGGMPPVPEPAPVTPFDHPEAQRRFRVVEGVEELERALEYPWDRWLVFLHPDQRAIVEKDWGGPARVRGSAGTGKTVVALHRAVHLARTDDTARVLLTTFSTVLAGHLSTQLKRLVGNETRIAERIEVVSMDDLARRMWRGARIAEDGEIAEWIGELFSAVTEPVISLEFVRAEWLHVVDLHNLKTWEGYRDFRRIGRKTRLVENRRQTLSALYQNLRARISEAGAISWGAVYYELAQEFASDRSRPYTHIVADEAQDISPAQLVFLGALAGSNTNGLFFAGDTGQRIFRQPFAWSTLGIEVRGRSRILHVNYRTSHQIRNVADRLLDAVVRDPDGYDEHRDRTVSVFNGPQPLVLTCSSQEEEKRKVAQWITERVFEGIPPQTIGLCVRSKAQRERAAAAVREAALSCDCDHADLRVITMHEAKGLEFRAMVVMACDDEVVPLQERIEKVGDEADLEEVYTTERSLLYVACTRAREQLLVTGVEPASEFLNDMV